MKNTWFACTGLLLITLLSAGDCPGADQGPDAAFQQALAEYQNAPTAAGAERVIRFATALQQLPPVPEEARRHFVRAVAAVRHARSPQDFAQAESEFQQALRLAPWWPEARHNLAVCLEALGKFEEAGAALKLYLRFTLPEDEARAVRDKLYMLEFEADRAAKEAALVLKEQHEKAERERAAAAERAQRRQREESVIRSLNGARYIYLDELRVTGSSKVVERTTCAIEIRDGELVFCDRTTFRLYPQTDNPVGVWRERGRVPLTGLEFTMHDGLSKGVISPDGDSIMLLNANTGEHRVTYTREKERKPRK